MSYEEDVSRLKKALKKRDLSLSQLYNTNGIFNIQKAQDRINGYDLANPKRFKWSVVLPILISLGILIFVALRFFLKEK